MIALFCRSIRRLRNRTRRCQRFYERGGVAILGGPQDSELAQLGVDRGFSKERIAQTAPLHKDFLRVRGHPLNVEDHRTAS